MNSESIAALSGLATAPNRDHLKVRKHGDQLAAPVLVGWYMVRSTALARNRLSERLARRVHNVAMRQTVDHFIPPHFTVQRFVVVGTPTL